MKDKERYYTKFNGEECVTEEAKNHTKPGTMEEDDNEGDSDENDEPSSTCPLFMEGLPSDFGTNPQLAAIASLLEDSDCDEKEAKTKSTVWSRSVTSANRAGGGGKIKSSTRAHRRLKLSASPYPSQKIEQSNKKASLGEAQLFLKMWKL